MDEDNLIDFLLNSEKTQERNKRSRSRTQRAQSTNREKRNSHSKQFRKFDSVELLNPDAKYNEFKHKVKEFESLLNKINGEEMMKVNILQLLISIQKTLAKKISVLFNSNIVNEISINDEVSSKSNLNNEKKLLSTSKTSLWSEISSSLSLKDLKDSDEYNDFLNRVTCPFCSKVLKNKIYLIKHLDESCQKENILLNNDHMPYSSFQILNKNTIKCNVCSNSVFKNLNKYFIHLNKNEHKINLGIACSTKSYTDDLYCSGCKILVPNNFTQLNFHMQHSYHMEKKNDNLIPSIMRNNFTCLLMTNKNVKCLACSLPFTNKNYFEQYYSHIKEKNHLKNLKILNVDFDKVYCEVCRDAVSLSDMISHVKSTVHEKKNSKFCLCYFCGDVFFGLNYLANHMTSECLEIISLRTHESLLKNEKDSINFDQVISNKSNNIQEVDVQQNSDWDKAKRHLLVKGQENIREVFLFFKKYGEVATVNKLNKNSLIVEFYDSEIVQRIMKLKPVIIDGVTVEITDDFDSELYLLNVNQKSDESNDNESNDEEKSLSDNNENPSAKSNFYKLVERIIPLTFINRKKNMDFESLIPDCIKTLECNFCSFIGFHSCELCGSEDELTLFCDFQKGFFQKFFTSDFEFNSTVVSKSYEKLSNSKHWENVIKKTKPLPFITCNHKETKKKCNIFFSRSVEKLSHMFSKLTKNRENVRNFFLVIKYWFQFNEMKIEEFEFVIISLALFFLSSEFNIPLLIELEEIHLEVQNLVHGKTRKEASLNSTSLNSLEAEDLVLQFLTFFLKFDFEKYAICLPLNYPVDKSILPHINSITKSMDLSSICILDPFLQFNIASDVKKNELKSLLIKLSKELL